MDDLTIDIDFDETDEDIEIDVNDDEENMDVEYDDLPVVPITEKKHNLLENRDWSNQHPISAVTELNEELTARPNTVITDAEILAL